MKMVFDKDGHKTIIGELDSMSIIHEGSLSQDCDIRYLQMANNLKEWKPHMVTRLARDGHTMYHDESDLYSLPLYRHNAGHIEIYDRKKGQKKWSAKMWAEYIMEEVERGVMTFDEGMKSLADFIMAE